MREAQIIDAPEWRALAVHAAEIERTHLRQLFSDDPDRSSSMALEVGDLFVDLSRNLLSRRTLSLLVDLARRVGMEEKRDAMFRGERVNFTEDRPALHVALRSRGGETYAVDGRDVTSEVRAVLARMSQVSAQIRSGDWKGSSGQPIRSVVNVGIGGSDLGPRMATEALDHLRPRGLDVRFVSNVDPVAMDRALEGLDPASTLFIVCSKTFSTLETLTNARTARSWLVQALGEASVARHFLAVSESLERVSDFGIDPSSTFPMWDWVGGRYSITSAIGLALMIAVGPRAFEEMLGGFHLIDRHFLTAPLERNLPAILGLLDVWYSDFLGARSRAVLPYSEALRLLPAYLQQLEMESLGKSVDRRGHKVPVATGLVVWGQPGTDGQHAFFQLLHQGTSLIPADFIGFARGPSENRTQHDLLMANLFAQVEALAFGRTAEELEALGVDAELIPHRAFEGNRPSTTILATELSPRVLGELLALYEHKVFCEAAVWDIDPFDQWGVELGKEIAQRISAELEVDEAVDSGASGSKLIERYRAWKLA